MSTLLQVEDVSVSFGGVRKEVSLALVEQVEIGDFVLVHVGFALNKVDRAEAERTLQLFAEAARAGDAAP